MLHYKSSNISEEKTKVHQELNLVPKCTVDIIHIFMVVLELFCFFQKEIKIFVILAKVKPTKLNFSLITKGMPRK